MAPARCSFPLGGVSTTDVLAAASDETEASSGTGSARPSLSQSSNCSTPSPGCCWSSVAGANQNVIETGANRRKEQRVRNRKRLKTNDRPSPAKVGRGPDLEMDVWRGRVAAVTELSQHPATANALSDADSDGARLHVRIEQAWARSPARILGRDPRPAVQRGSCPSPQPVIRGHAATRCRLIAVSCDFVTRGVGPVGPAAGPDP
jgi:hypothetical protein